MTEQEPRPEIATTLGATRTTARRRWWPWIAAIVLTSLAAAGGVMLLAGSEDEIRFQTAKLERADLTVVVTATGTLQPTNQVDVGSELSGIIKTVEVDFNDRVQVGQVLARLDTAKLEAQVVQSEAALAAAQARVRESEANEDEMRRRLQRAQELSARNFVSEEALVTAEAAHKRAVAALQSARSQVQQGMATLLMDRTNLNKAAIRSPINGTVLARKGEPGQTVAATLQAPVLFTLAEDLTKMELHVDVDEADIGQVREGQSATFTVDAYPNREFPSTVSEVRNAAKTVSGVVTYETVLVVNNDNLLLRPGMTGTASITVNHLRDVLVAPNAALRFAPPTPREQAGRTLVSRLLPGPPRPPPRSVQMKSERRQHTLWTLRDGKPVAIPVGVGPTDGRVTEITRGDVQPGLDVLTDTLRAAQ